LRIRQFAQDADHVLQILLTGRGQAQRAGGALGQPELLLLFTERNQNVALRFPVLRPARHDLVALT
jgi:hypothetical protein